MRSHHSLGMSAQASRLAVILFLCSGSAALAQPAPSLGAADSFVILARTGVADLDPGPTTVTGSVGCPAGIADSIAPNPGGKFVKDAIVQRALRDSTALYDGLAGRSCTDPLTEFPGTLLPNRVYCFAANAELTKTLTFAGTRDDSWYIKIAGCLTLDRDAAMLLQGDALSSHIFWAVGDCVTLGVNSGVAGNLIARNDITFGRGVTLAGRAISLQGAVTLDGDAINLCGTLIALATPGVPIPAAAELAERRRSGLRDRGRRRRRRRVGGHTAEHRRVRLRCSRARRPRSCRNPPLRGHDLSSRRAAAVAPRCEGM